MTINTDELDVIDVHAHPFLDARQLSEDDFTAYASFGGVRASYLTRGGVDESPELRNELQRFWRNTTYHQRMVHDLAKYFDTEPRLEAVVEARNTAVRSGYTEYVARLYADAGLVGAVMDFGHPLPALDIDAVRAELPVDIVPIYRIEPLIVDLLAEEIGWDEFRQRYDDAIADALTSRGYRGLKSIIAYRTGLDISPLSRSPDNGLVALDAIRRGLGGGAMKRLRDHLLCRAIELCIEFDVPMQIHTGMGDHEINLPLSRPAFLMDLLRFPAFRACRVILVHAGYPYHSEAGYIAGVLPRVFCDIGEGVPFAGHAARRILRETLEMAPYSKVLYSSDGYGVPEILYTSALVGKQAVAEVLDELVESRWLLAENAQSAAKAILSGTARELYRM
jgi:uncharacterized protein